VDNALTAYRFDDAARAIYDFFWGEFCDWYIELIKPRMILEDDTKGGAATREDGVLACRNLVSLFEASLRLLHPVMPFITEEIWHALYDGKPPLASIALASYPQTSEKQINLDAETEMAILQDLIASVRNIRAELKVEHKQRVPIQIFAQDPAIQNLIEQNRGAVERLANVEAIACSEISLSKLPGARHTARFDVHVIYEQKIDVAAERARLTKQLEQFGKEISNGERQLSNEQFLAKAPANVAEGIRKRLLELHSLREKAQLQLDELVTAVR
jgi:valyl-tRNA synthetase